MQELKCTCGECNVCKTRERMREKRAQEKARSSGERHEQRKGPGSELGRDSRETVTPLPASSHELVQQTDNFIWVRGGTPNLYGGPDSLEQRIQAEEHKAREAIREIRATISSFSQKERRSSRNKYWYQWRDGRWNYVCPVGKGDPRIEYERDKDKLGEEILVKVHKMRSCIIKKFREHILVDTALFQKHVDKKLPKDIIMVRDVIA